MMIKKIACAYIRVSTHMQEELSPDAQIRLIKEYAVKNNYDLPEEFIFIDKGISGKRADKRPEFLRMISMAKVKPSPFDAILVWKFSRFARNQEESIVYKSMLRNKCKVDVISITESISDDVYGGLIERIIEWMDEFYSIRLSEDVFRGMTENALRGNFQASPALGYMVEEKKKPPVIVEDQARIVRLIFQLYTSSSMGFYDIARHLNRIGYKTKKNNTFEARTVKYILQNPIYKGFLRWNYKNSVHELKDASEWIIKKAPQIPAIVSEEMWDMANDRIKREYHPKNGKPVAKKRHWLSGLVKCSSCGASLSTSVAKDKRYGRTYVSFQCYRYLKGKCLESHSISEKKLVPLVLETLKEDMNRSFIEYEYIQESNIDDHEDILKIGIKRLESREARMKEAYLNGVDSLEEYKENKERIKKERDALLDQIQKNNEIQKNVNMPSKIRGVYDILVSDQYSVAEKHAAISSIVKKIVFDKKNKTLSFHYYIKDN